jgi:hypothetical protein
MKLKKNAMEVLVIRHETHEECRIKLDGIFNILLA